VIRDDVQNRAQAFQATWSKRLSPAPVLRLDSTWPSIGVVDLITFTLRTLTDLNSEEAEQLKNASSYMASLAHQCWTSFGAQVVLEDTNEGVILRAQGGEYLDSGEEHKFEVEKEFGTMLQVASIEIPVLADFFRPVNFDSNWVSPFSLGVMLGLNPMGSGPWLDRELGEIQPQIDNGTRELARTCAEYYAKVFPDEPLGQVAELYLGDLVYPPSMMKEELPALDAVDGVLRFCKEYKIGAQGLLDLSSNLARTPDELLSGAGIALYGALGEGDPSPEMLAVAEAKGVYMGLLRPAMLKAREGVELEGEWIGNESYGDAEAKRFEFELKMGFLPWVKLSSKRLFKPGNAEPLNYLLSALAYFDMERAMSICDDLISETPMDIEVRLQRIYLDVLSGEFDKADKGFRALLTEPGCESNSKLFHLWGLSDLLSSDSDATVEHLKKAYQLGGEEPHLQIEILNDYAWALISVGQLDDALDVLEEAKGRKVQSVTEMLNQAFALQNMGREREAAAIRRSLYRLTPTDRRVFSNLASET